MLSAMSQVFLTPRIFRLYYYDNPRWGGRSSTADDKPAYKNLIDDNNETENGVH